MRGLTSLCRLGRLFDNFLGLWLGPPYLRGRSVVLILAYHSGFHLSESRMSSTKCMPMAISA